MLGKNERPNVFGDEFQRKLEQIDEVFKQDTAQHPVSEMSIETRTRLLQVQLDQLQETIKGIPQIVANGGNSADLKIVVDTLVEDIDELKTLAASL